jgi:hypothetical protein
VDVSPGKAITVDKSRYHELSEDQTSITLG